MLAAWTLLALSSVWAEGKVVKPKYAPETTPLSLSHEYFEKHSVPQFWALIPYYVPQQDETSCSVASVAMMVNAARVGQKLTAEDTLVTQKQLLEKVKGTAWKSGFMGALGHGVTLDQLGVIVQESLKTYGIHPLEVEVVHADSAKPGAEKLHQTLLDTLKNPRELIIANFNQGVYTGDVDAGHISPVGAYDPDKKRVLVMDVDRQWYEPYWISEEAFLKGMATQDKSADNRTRGYVVVKLPQR